MAFYRQSRDDGRPLLPCEVSCPQPYADACSQPCVTSCGDSRAIVYPPPVVITFPGPILSSCPQESIVGSSAPLGLGNFSSHGSFLEAQSPLGPGPSAGSRYSYTCYGRKTTFRPSKPYVILPDTKIPQEQEKVRGF